MEETKDEIFEEKRTSNRFFKIIVFLTAVLSFINIVGIYEFYKILIIKM